MTDGPDPLDGRVSAIALRQHGNISRRQLLSIGANDEAIAHRVRVARLHRVHRGVYAVGRPPLVPLEHAMAAVLACDTSALLSHASALAIWGFAKEWPHPPHVTGPGDHRLKGLVFHHSRTLVDADRRIQLGIPTTSPARTLLDCAPSLGPDLTRTVSDALHSPYVSESQLTDTLARLRIAPGAKLLRQFVDGLEAGLTRSQFEDAFLAFCERYGLPRPRVNVRVAGHLVDALFEEERLIVECDGWNFHRTRMSFERDRDRDADTLAAGFATVRLTWDRMKHQPRREADRLLEILEARRRQGAA